MSLFQKRKVLALPIALFLLVGCKRDAAGGGPDATTVPKSVPSEPVVGWCGVDHPPENWPAEGGLDALAAQLCPGGFKDVTASTAAPDSVSVEGGKEHLFRMKAVSPATVGWSGKVKGCSDMQFGLWMGSYVRQVHTQDPGGLPRERSYSFTIDSPVEAIHAYLRVACPGGQVISDHVEVKRFDPAPAATPQPTPLVSRAVCLAECEQPADVEMDAWDDLPRKEREEAQRNWLEGEKAQIRASPKYKACIERCSAQPEAPVVDGEHPGGTR